MSHKNQNILQAGLTITRPNCYKTALQMWTDIRRDGELEKRNKTFRVENTYLLYWQVRKNSKQGGFVPSVAWCSCSK